MWHFRQQQIARFSIILVFWVLTGFTFRDISDREKVTRRQNDNSTEKKKVKELFEDWQRQEIKAKHFLSERWCNGDSVLKIEAKENLDERMIYGFPSDSTEYKFSFADLNNDGRFDGLVVFTPVQCDGGNGSIWTQWQVFILSKKNIYNVTDTLRVDRFASTPFDSSGFYWLNGIATDKIFGTYFEFKPDDGYCCPSIQRPVIFDFVERRLSSIGENIGTK